MEKQVSNLSGKACMLLQVDVNVRVAIYSDAMCNCNRARSIGKKCSSVGFLAKQNDIAKDGSTSDKLKKCILYLGSMSAAFLLKCVELAMTSRPSLPSKQ